MPNLGRWHLFHLRLSLPRQVSFSLVIFLLLTLACGLPHPATPLVGDSASDQRSNPAISKGKSKKPIAHDWRDAVLYFAIVDRFADGDPDNNQDVDRDAKGAFHGGDLKGLTSRLDDLADLGVNALWITPLVKNIAGPVHGAGFPDWGYHGYWAEDFTQLDPRFGSEADLATLVKEAHLRGIKVLLDVVYNHCGYGASYLELPYADQWLRTGRRGSPCGNDDLTMCLAGLPDFKTENDAVGKYLMDAHIGLAKRVGLDGFRLDTVKHVDHPFWQAHRARTKAELGDDFFLLGEVWGGDAQVLDPWFEPDEMDAGFDFGFKGSVQAFVQGRGRTIAFSRYLARRHQVREGYHLAYYLSSHDVPGSLFELQGHKQRFKLAVALKLTTFGIPVIYYGEEVGRVGGDWPENRSDMPWGDLGIEPGAGDPRDEEMRAYFKRLIAIRAGNPALSRGRYEELSTEGDLLVFARATDADGTVVVAINRDSEPAEVRIALPRGWDADTVREVLHGHEVSVAEGSLKIRIPAERAGIYTAAGLVR